MEGEAEDVHGQVIPHDDQEVREGEEGDSKLGINWRVEIFSG